MSKSIASMAMATQPSSRLPLHPRQAQAFFFELLQTPTADAIPMAQGTLAQRLASLQVVVGGANGGGLESYKGGIADMKRGRWFRLLDTAVHDDELVLLRLSPKGDRLQLHRLCPAPKATTDSLTRSHGRDNNDDEDDDERVLVLATEVPLGSISHCGVCPGSVFHLHTTSTLNNEQSQDIDNTGDLLRFEAESECLRDQWMLTLATGISAHRDAQDKYATGAIRQDPHESLLWQAIRLRIAELSRSMSLRNAVTNLTQAYASIVARESTCALPDREKLFLLINYD